MLFPIFCILSFPRRKPGDGGREKADLRREEQPGEAEESGEEAASEEEIPEDEEISEEEELSGDEAPPGDAEPENGDAGGGEGMNEEEEE